MKKFLRKIGFLRRYWRIWLAVKNSAIDTWVKYTSNGECPYGLRGKYRFFDRRKKSDSVLMVLAGYKKQLWADVFSRIKKFAPADLDVCVITSGLKDEGIENLCAEHGWSYLATARNSLTLAQNIAIALHAEANWIYKIDEDVFLTEGFFQKLREAYSAAERECRSGIGMVAPLLNVNGFCYVRILEKIGKVKEWENRFGPLRYTEGLYDDRAILEDAEAAKFMWRLGALDEMNAKFSREPFVYSISPYRFSIGAILFPRSTWVDMGMFNVATRGCGLGDDEVQLCSYCMMHTKAKVVCENSYVGHLAFGPQTAQMLKFHMEERVWFCD